MKAEKIKIMIVDDNASFRLAAKLFLENESNCVVVAEASNGHEFLTMIKNVDVDIILMDIHMPTLDGLNATREHYSNNPYSKIIAVTMYSGISYLQKLIEAGFRGYVNKNDFFTEITEAIEDVNKGGFYFKNPLKID